MREPLAVMPPEPEEEDNAGVGQAAPDMLAQPCPCCGGHMFISGEHEIIGALLKAEIAAKNARSINYQMTIAKLPLAKELAGLSFEGTPINGALIEQLRARRCTSAPSRNSLARCRICRRSASRWCSCLW